MQGFRPIQKGIGQLRFRTLDEELVRARVSVRRWWWEYLRLSKNYWLVCQTSTSRQNPRVVDERIRWIYRKFGDVYSSDFDTWYAHTGSRIFAEQEALPAVTEIERDFSNLRESREGLLLVDIPLSLSQTTINRQINRILKKYIDERPTNKLETSKSQFPINPVRFRLHTLQKMHEVWCLHRELIAKPVALGESPDRYSTKGDLFRIGKVLRLSPSNELIAEDVELNHKRLNIMRATVSRYLSRANLLIDNVEIGQFPVFKKVTPKNWFTKKQMESHRELEKQWWDLDLSSTLSGTKVLDAKRVVYSWYG